MVVRAGPVFGVSVFLLLAGGGCEKPRQSSNSGTQPGVSAGRPDTGMGTNMGVGGTAGPGGQGGGGQVDAPVQIDAAHDGFICSPNAPCPLPDQPCRVGETVCEGNQATCLPSAKPLANGTSCGTDMVCQDGACVACKAGIECPLDGQPCKVGQIQCASGKAECVEASDAPNGKSCGDGVVCRDGACAMCGAGDPCVPANPCHNGVLACAGGVATCNDDNTPKAAGTTCGLNRVCSSTGECVACTAGMTCELPNQPCKTGKIECGTGAPVCVVAGDAPNGMGCGNDRVCSQGMCVACNAGSPCTPMNRCHNGTLTCDSGRPVCMDSGTNVVNGTNCGMNQYCSNGACVACTPNVSCSTLDVCKNGTTSCETGTSQCRQSGNAPNGKRCGDGMTCQNGTCVRCPDETCNGRDDDCDGQVDEDLTRSCNTACGNGVETCRNGSFGGCNAPRPGTETCNGRDDDCDNQVDEGFGSQSCGQGECARTVQTCANGRMQTCQAGSPGNEVCDGKDNNCNGQTDEGLGSESCGQGECRRTVQRCVNGRSQQCVAPGGSNEVCDGKDNNCNGQTDEGLGSETCGQGECRRTVQRCANGRPQTCTPGARGAETCNGRDDDCDGSADDNIAPRSCACGGTQTCRNGEFSGCPAPPAEQCNGRDDNCDGQVDNGASCPGGQTCSGGECKKGRGQSCGGGSECASGNCSTTCVSGPRSGQACSSGSDCDQAVQCVGGGCFISNDSCGTDADCTIRHGCGNRVCL